MLRELHTKYSQGFYKAERDYSLEVAIRKTMVKALWISIFLLGIQSNATAGSKPPAICDEFRMLSKDGGLARYALEGVEDTRPANIGKKLIPNVDIDGDDVSDELLWLPQGSGSAIPSDPSDIVIKLSKSGGGISFEAMRFFLFRYRSKIFAVASSSENINESSIYKVSPTGFELVCTKL